MTSVLLILSLLVAPPVEQKKRDWKEAKIIDVKYVEKHDDFSGDIGTGAGAGGNTRFVIATWVYVVESEGMRYELQEQNTKSTYNTGETLKFAIEKKNWYYLDAKGKEKKGDVVGRKEVKP